MPVHLLGLCGYERWRPDTDYPQSTSYATSSSEAV
jgi:hypothetical protein